LVGDDGVGKSSIITTLIKESFVGNVQHVVPEFRISPESSREKVTTRIIDSSSRVENKSQLELEIKKADVLCIVYAIDRMDTFYRISEFWLPYIRCVPSCITHRQLGKNVPVVLVGNKIDLRSNSGDEKTLENLIAPVMNEFKVIFNVF
jgi:Ras family protein T1